MTLIIFIKNTDGEVIEASVQEKPVLRPELCLKLRAWKIPLLVYSPVSNFFHKSSILNLACSTPEIIMVYWLRL